MQHVLLYALSDLRFVRQLLGGTWFKVHRKNPAGYVYATDWERGKPALELEGGSPDVVCWQFDMDGQHIGTFIQTPTAAWEVECYPEGVCLPTAIDHGFAVTVSASAAICCWVLLLVLLPASGVEHPEGPALFCGVALFVLGYVGTIFRLWRIQMRAREVSGRKVPRD